jgi:tRNA-binding protein
LQCERYDRDHQSAAATPKTGEALREGMTFTPAPVKPAIDFSVFEQIDIRLGTIVSAEDMEHSKKLARLKVDFGDHQRTIIAGLKQERTNLAELLGKQALFVVNLEPRRMAGELSEGMLFDLGYADGILPALAVPERPLPNGTRAG